MLRLGNLELTTTGILIVFLIMDTTTVKPVEGVREGAANRNVRPTRRTASSSGSADDTTSMSLAIIIPCLIVVAFFILLCCCLRMKSSKRRPEDDEEGDIPQINLQPDNQDDDTISMSFLRAPPSYNSLPNLVDQEPPPPTYDDWVLSQKTTNFIRRLFQISRENSVISNAENITAHENANVGNNPSGDHLRPGNLPDIAEESTRNIDENTGKAGANNTNPEKNTGNAGENNAIAEEDNRNAGENNAIAEENYRNACENNAIAEENQSNASENNAIPEENNSNGSENNAIAEENNSNASENNAIAEENDRNAGENNRNAEGNNCKSAINEGSEASENVGHVNPGYVPAADELSVDESAGAQNNNLSDVNYINADSQTQTLPDSTLPSVVIQNGNIIEDNSRSNHDFHCLEVTQYTSF